MNTLFILAGYTKKGNFALKGGCEYRIAIVDFPKDQRENGLEKCANRVTTKTACSNAFFYRANKGRCYCERFGSDCKRITSTDVNEYSLNVGQYRQIIY